MKKEVRTGVYDDGLRMGAYRFEGIVRPFPNHFHEYYVIGFMEDGERVLSCKNQEYTITKGDVLLFNPGGSHACAQSDGGTLDYRNFTITKEIMLDLAEEATGRVVGADVTDESGSDHLGIIEFPVPILRGTRPDIRRIREKLYQPDFRDLTVVDFSDLAQGCKTYEEFIEKMGRAPESSLQYFGVAIFGPKKKVNILTGRMPLLR